MKRPVLCVIGIAIAVNLPLAAFLPSLQSAHGAPVGQEDPGEGEYPQVIITDTIDASGNGTSVAQVSFKNADTYALTFDLWWWAASASQQSNIHAWDAQGPVSVQTETIGYRLYIYVLFRHSLPPGETYTYWLSTDIQSLAWWNGNVWSRSFCLCAGWPVGEYRVKLRLPSAATVVVANPRPITAVRGYVEWVFRNLSSSQCGSTSASYTTSVCNRIPVILVHGWHGSEQDSLAKDYQMGLFAEWLKPDGYTEEDNSLFYATGIDSTQSMLGNGLALRQTIYRAQERSGCSAFDIIGHSFGGLTARAYVESGWYAKDRLPVSLGGRGITIRQVFMLGTPNGGVDPHFTVVLLGLLSELGQLVQGNPFADLPSIQELLYRMPGWNAEHTQPAEVAYRLIAGTARNCAYGAGEAPCDGFVLQESVHALSAADLRAQYPNVQTPTTPDIHGCYPKGSPTKPRAYNCPDNSTYKSEIAPYLGGFVGVEEALEIAQLELSGPSDWAGGVHTPLVTGVITTGQTITATVNIDAIGTTEFYLGWPVGNLDLSLTDPVGTSIISSTAETDPNVDFFALETDALLNYESYVISDTVTGDWVLTVEAIDTYSDEIPFAAFAIPDSELSLSVFTDQDWYPKNQESIITATLTLSVTAVIGASTEATIYRPDIITDTVTLYDDGAHNDDSADDGIYGNSYASTDVGGYYAVLATASGNLEGSAYERAAETGFSVCPETASLTGSYLDYPEDANGNGKHEHLVLNIGIDVGQTGEFQLSAKLLDGNGDLVLGASDYIPLTVGIQDVPLRFDGEAIRTHGVDGPFTITDVYLFDAAGAPVKLDEAFDVWTTAAYDQDVFGDDWLAYVPLVTKSYSP